MQCHCRWTQCQLMMLQKQEASRTERTETALESDYSMLFSTKNYFHRKALLPSPQVDFCACPSSACKAPPHRLQAQLQKEHQNFSHPLHLTCTFSTRGTVGWEDVQEGCSRKWSPSAKLLLCRRCLQLNTISQVNLGLFALVRHYHNDGCPHTLQNTTDHL